MQYSLAHSLLPCGSVALPVEDDGVLVFGEEAEADVAVVAEVEEDDEEEDRLDDDDELLGLLLEEELEDELLEELLGFRSLR